MKVVIFPNPYDATGVAVVHPNPDFSFEEICRKDVPAGEPYLIIDQADLPTDRTFRNAWEADFSNPDGYGIGADAWFAEQAAAQASQVIDATAEEAAE